MTRTDWQAIALVVAVGAVSIGVVLRANAGTATLSNGTVQWPQRGVAPVVSEATVRDVVLRSCYLGTDGQLHDARDLTWGRW